MKNLVQPMPAELHAENAIQKIQKWIETNHPRLNAITKTKMIIECLIELAEEKRFIAAQ